MAEEQHPANLSLLQIINYILCLLHKATSENFQTEQIIYCIIATLSLLLIYQKHQPTRAQYNMTIYSQNQYQLNRCFVAVAHTKSYTIYIDKLIKTVNQNHRLSRVNKRGKVASNVLLYGTCFKQNKINVTQYTIIKAY